MTALFVLIPSLEPTGPVKGAVAMCNGLAKHLPVTLVPLKESLRQVSGIDDGVSVSELGQIPAWTEKRRVYNGLLAATGSRKRVASLSLCLPADAFNASFRFRARIMSSVRGNLFVNYRHDFGRPGTLIARAHYLLLRSFDEVLAISDTMHRQLRSLGIKKVRTVGNFVDEPYLTQFRGNQRTKSTRIRLVFVGSLSPRKRPELMLAALQGLLNRHLDCEILFLGDGSLRSTLEHKAKIDGLQDRVHFFGNVNDPFEIIQSADLAVMPSESEGVSRAMLESLFFGLPCVARRVDANEELINSSNGICFNQDAGLCDAIHAAIDRFVVNSKFDGNEDSVLIPPKFRQEPNIQTLLELIT